MIRSHFCSSFLLCVAISAPVAAAPVGLWSVQDEREKDRLEAQREAAKDRRESRREAVKDREEALREADKQRRERQRETQKYQRELEKELDKQRRQDIRELRKDRLTTAIETCAACDRNHDGIITRSEWPGNDVSFRNHDRNRDGVISDRDQNVRIRR
jgi:hypothetical protein